MMLLMQKTDQEIITDYLNGEKEEFTEIVNRYLKMVYNFVYRLVSSEKEAEDITQEVFLKVWKNVKNFDVEKSLKTWIFTIAKNTAFDYLRKRKDIPMSVFDNDEGENVIEDNLEDIERRPDEVFALAQNKKQINKVIKELSIIQKEVIILKYVNEMSLSEVSEIMDMSKDTVKSHHRRAILKMRKLLSNKLT